MLVPVMGFMWVCYGLVYLHYVIVEVPKPILLTKLWGRPGY